MPGDVRADLAHDVFHPAPTELHAAVKFVPDDARAEEDAQDRAADDGDVAEADSA